MQIRWTALALLGVAMGLCCHRSGELVAEPSEAGENPWAARADYYEKALQERPGDIELRIELLRASLEASYVHLDRAKAYLAEDENDAAAFELERALEFDPTNRYALARLRELRAAGGSEPAPTAIHERLSFPGREARIDPSSSDEISLDFPEGTSLKLVLETLAKLAGVNILFDESYRDRTLEVRLDDVTFQEALDLLTSMNGLFYKVTHSSVTVRENRP